MVILCECHVYIYKYVYKYMQKKLKREPDTSIYTPGAQHGHSIAINLEDITLGMCVICVGTTVKRTNTYLYRHTYMWFKFAN